MDLAKTICNVFAFTSYKLRGTVFHFCIICLVPGMILSQNAPSKKILIFSKTEGYRHKSIEAGIEAIKLRCAQNHISADATENSRWFNKKKLREYDAVLFLSTSGDVLGKKQETALQDFIWSGGGFVGIHGATTTEYDWEWFGNMIGGYFDGHPEPQEATLIIDDSTHPATKHLPRTWIHFDEWYNFRWINDDFNVLISVDESTYKGGKHKNGHPIAWYKSFEGGRIFYTALGHTDESYSEEHFLNHLMGGILYAVDKTTNE